MQQKKALKSISKPRHRLITASTLRVVLCGSLLILIAGCKKPIVGGSSSLAIRSVTSAGLPDLNTLLDSSSPELQVLKGKPSAARISTTVDMARFPEAALSGEEEEEVDAPRRQLRINQTFSEPDRFRMSDTTRQMTRSTPILAPLTPTNEINAVQNNGWIPPDASGAVGPSHILTCVNGTVQIQSRTNGTVMSRVTLNVFFASTGIPNAFDPRAIYDFYSDRWVVICCAAASDPQSSILIAVSDTGNPLGTWHLHAIDAVLNDIDWSDYPHIGFNKERLAITCNRFRIDPADTEDGGSTLLVFLKSELYANNPAHRTFNLPSLFFSLVPATTYDAYPVLMVVGNTRVYLPPYPPVNAAPCHNLIFIYEKNGQEEVQYFQAPIRWWGDFWDTEAPTENFADQPAGGDKINCGDDRIQSAVFRAPYLYLTHNAFVPWGGAPTSCATRFAAIGFGQPSVATLIQNNDAGAHFLTYPSLAVTPDRDVLIGFTLMGADATPSSSIAYRRGSDAPGDFRSIRVVHPGAGNYPDITDTSGRRRWGDYSTTALDPSDPGSIWTLQTYSQQSARARGWATSWMQFRLNTMP